MFLNYYFENMKKYHKHFLKILMLSFLCLLSFNKAHALSYYDVISSELDICEKQGGKIVGMQDGKVVESSGCPGCFCQFKDGSICIMEQLGDGCEAGRFKSYFRVEEAYQLPDIKVGPGGTAGYVAANPGIKQFYFIDKSSVAYEKFRYASANELVKMFGTEWVDKNDANFYLDGVSICNGGNIETGRFALYFNNSKLKDYPSVLPGECIGDKIYLMADIKNSSGKYEFVVKTNVKELSKDNNIYSFLIDKTGFKYLKYYDYGEGVVVDMPHPYYLTFDDKKVNATSLKNDNDQIPIINNVVEKTSWFNKIINYLFNLFK